MSPYKQIWAIGEYIGYKNLKIIEGESPFSGVFVDNPNIQSSIPRIRLPDYTRDLNAMHEAEKYLEDEHEKGRLMATYAIWKLPSVCQIYHPKNQLISQAGSIDTYLLVHATAAQRAEAFLKTIGKWEE